MKRHNQQRRWQLRKNAAGLCGSCGKNPLHTKTLCYGCAKKSSSSRTGEYCSHREWEEQWKPISKDIVAAYIPGETSMYDLSQKFGYSYRAICRAFKDNGVKYVRPRANPKALAKRKVLAGKYRRNRPLAEEAKRLGVCGVTLRQALSEQDIKHVTNNDLRRQELAKKHRPGESVDAASKRLGVSWSMMRRALDDWA